MKGNGKKNPGLSRFFSFLEFSVIYWIRNNFPILCGVRPTKTKVDEAKDGKWLIQKTEIPLE
jgi:hypothetical protein